MNESQWKVFLTEYNQELLSYEQILEALPREIIKAGWLGQPGALEEEVSAAERRLGIRLPPSYRAFLKTSNGWRLPSSSISDLLPAAKLDWFRKQNQGWIDAYTGPVADLPPISDAEYFQYGADQDCCKFRSEYLQATLQVSEVDDGAVVLLNPKVVNAEGEWETWFFANWLPGAQRYRSFAEWIEAERRTCRKQLKRLPKNKVRQYATSKKLVSAKKAQAAARRGEVNVALESLETFAAKGDDAAAASLAELYAFLGQWDKVITYAGRLIANPGAVFAGNVFNDMVNLLGRAGHRSGEWARVIDVVEGAVTANARRHCPEGQEAFRDRNDKILQNLIEYARRQGGPPHELLAIFGVRNCMADMSDEERKAWYEDAVRNVDSLRPDLKDNPQAKAEYFFSLAKGVLEDEALRLYDEHGASFVMAWSAAEYVARVRARRGNLDAAWAAIEHNLKTWWPVDHAQVAPVILLTDECLEKLMSVERCQFVLATPRGPEAAKAGK